MKPRVCAIDVRSTVRCSLDGLADCLIVYQVDRRWRSSAIGPRAGLLSIAIAPRWILTLEVEASFLENCSHALWAMASSAPLICKAMSGTKGTEEEDHGFYLTCSSALVKLSSLQPSSAHYQSPHSSHSFRPTKVPHSDLPKSLILTHQSPSF
ncbi:hypothetical protein BJX70DRAFT_22140 [Aspergillus crustosus]